MKKLLLLIPLLIWVCLAFGAINEYSVSQSTQTFTLITGGTVVATGTTDDTVYSVPVPFPFTYNEVGVTTMSMCANGYIGFNAGTSSFGYNPIMSTLVGAGVITPLGRDLQGGTNGEMRWEVFGTTPNRYAIYQWKNYRAYGTSYLNDNWNFQIILYETINQFAFRYGSFIWASTLATTVQVGARGATNADFLARATTTNWSATTAGATNDASCSLTPSIFPPSGLQFLFAPPVAGTPPNPANAVYPANGATWVPTNASLSWVSGGGQPTGYKMYFGSTPSPAYVGDLGNVTSWAPPAMSPGQTYYWQVVPYNVIGDAVGCPVWSFQVIPPGLVQIGTGTSTSSLLPIYTYYGYSYSQVIYLQSEINTAGQRISALAYYWDGTAASTVSRNWTVYMGHTTRTQFSSASDWVPVGEMTQVFTGMLDIPAVAGWINIPLNVPFVYDNVNNLVIAVDENEPGYDYPYGYFHNTPVANTRGLIYYSDGTNPDPNAPPAAMYTYAAIANVLLAFEDLPTTPIFSVTPTTWNFGTQIIGTLTNKQFMLQNTGSGTLDIQSIAVTGAYYSLTVNPAPISLSAGQSANFTVQYLPLAAGTHAGNVAITYGGEVFNIPLTGSCYDPTIYAPIHEEFSTGVIPAGWSLSGPQNWL
ncbi:MAG: choice-of-anchor D domain-containing protein, partial [Candidatus Cloacimonadaceae bacterium]|nr:choice-of-anchor D domain-containing protein [Candidatus Cloacimonadaceae bacterium]